MRSIPWLIKAEFRLSIASVPRETETLRRGAEINDALGVIRHARASILL